MTKFLVVRNKCDIQQFRLKHASSFDNYYNYTVLSVRRFIAIFSTAF